MLLFAKIAAVVVASVTSLLGIWQTANGILGLQPYLTLPSTPTYLNVLGLGFPIHSCSQILKLLHPSPEPKNPSAPFSTFLQCFWHNHALSKTNLYG
jgi:hypothetical protein